jgi:hypothetical protein
MTTAWVHTHLPRLLAGERDCLSVKVPGQRIAYASWISLRNAEFRVSEHGRLRCLTSGVRNVHAWVVGEEVLRVAEQDVFPGAWASWPLSDPVGYRRALYDPFKGPSFVDSETLEPLARADWVILSGKRVFYTGA